MFVEKIPALVRKRESGWKEGASTSKLSKDLDTPLSKSVSLSKSFLARLDERYTDAQQCYVCSYNTQVPLVKALWRRMVEKKVKENVSGGGRGVPAGPPKKAVRWRMTVRLPNTRDFMHVQASRVHEPGSVGGGEINDDLSLSLSYTQHHKP